MGVGNLLHDVETESGARVARRVAGVEHALLLVRRNAGSVVGDVEAVLGVSERVPNRNRDGRAAVLDGIAEDVRNQLAKAGSIGED